MSSLPLHVHPHFNAEEAAIAASEFVQSLDNLPGEVAFLLAEIRDKDERISQHLNRANQRHVGLTKGVKNINATTTPATATFPLPIPPGAPIPTAHLSTKDAQNVAKIQAEWAKIQQLQEDKVRLAERLERIVSRARERGRAEWRRVGGMDVDEDGLEIKVATPEGMPAPTKRSKKATPLAAQISAGFGVLSASNSPRQGSMPPPPLPRSQSGARSRAGSRGRGRGHSLAMSVEPEPVPDMEMEVDIIDGTEVEADDQLYCFCQQKSFGEMIGCDNDKCKYEWFHIKCVNLTAPLPETWYCPECVKTLGLTSSDGKRERKGRKK
ncbi:hypothetical protein CC85DRAFT_288783 [Cutaneotrichosporon oleaginosum]|uniref:Chromatin modification-related protein n=1 Tax=Cutaneotrichosporon oleaginosum TaxID=879819 RepID=A0A0J0XDZ4_9TREE|nr:uncharacterized protein CC85DRAFT_288783 [Cutaneotrichosporon oleaginosum]KLT39233.1 hypothetical protein CC85DRAFT_288783 [Cutaneotrichosporon oleaginosum]TXT05726.1 hypothetical protein COLE_07046 [Cutaneotrichosporon oleaginosum]